MSKKTKSGEGQDSFDPYEDRRQATGGRDELFVLKGHDYDSDDRGYSDANPIGTSNGNDKAYDHRGQSQYFDRAERGRFFSDRIDVKAGKKEGQMKRE